MRDVLSVLLATLVASAAPAGAAQVGDPRAESNAFHCSADSRYVLLKGSGYERDIAAILALHGDRGMLRICNDALGNHHYFLRNVHRIQKNVCRLTEDEVFPLYRSTNVKGEAPHMIIGNWTLLPPSEWSSKGYKDI
jgi:hypothetical protein